MQTHKSIDDLAKILWEFNLMRHTLQRVDCAVVLGSNDIRVAQRGAEIFLQGYAPSMIFSGSSGRLTKGVWSKTEAEMFADEAQKMGVPEDKIILEKASTNTGENISYVKKLVEEKGLPIKSIIVVTKPYMERRAYATCKKIWPEVDVIVTSPAISFEDYPNEHISKEQLINYMVGDTQRLKVYAEKGFQIAQDIPATVWSAWEALVMSGFTTQVLGE